MADYKALIALATEKQNDEQLGGLIGDLAEALKSSIEARTIDEGKMAAQADDLKDRIAATERERDEALTLCERLRLEAQIHAGEARTANATIREIYQAATGSTGEPGSWNGALPVRAELERLRRDLSEARSALAAAQAEAALGDDYGAVHAVREVVREGLGFNTTFVDDDVRIAGGLAQRAVLCGLANDFDPDMQKRMAEAAEQHRASNADAISRAALAKGGRDDG